MDRRGFLKGLAAVVGGIALNEAVPLGRVWSFPKQVKCANNAFALTKGNIITMASRNIIVKIPPPFIIRGELVDYFNPPQNLAEMYRAGAIGRALIIDIDSERNVSSSLIP